MKTVKILLLVTVCAYIFGMFIRFQGTRNMKVSGEKKRVGIQYFQEYRREAEEWIRTEGGTKAYEKVNIKFKDNPDDSHGELHIFGELLYKIEGLDAFSVCDQNFGFGCFHGFLGQAIGDRGIDVVRKIDSECVKKFGVGGLGCTHGIGHGLGEYFGPKRLNEQLNTCKSLSWKGKFLGCQDGAIMEYHFPAEKKNINVVLSRREVNPENPYEPCTTLADVFKSTCYYRLPSWWILSDMDFGKIGKLCSEARDSEARQACFIGIGNAFHPQYKLTVNTIREFCKMNLIYPDGAYCFAGSRWALFSLARKSDAEMVCVGLTEKDKDICESQWNLVSDQQTQKP